MGKVLIIGAGGVGKMCIRDSNYGIEFTVTVTGNRYDRVTVFSLDFLGVAAVTGITAAVSYTHLDVYKRQRLLKSLKHYKPIN